MFKSKKHFIKHRKPSLLIVSQYYPPETGASQNRLRCLAQHLSEQGYKVSVLTAMPNYPVGKIFPGYRNRIFCQENMGTIRVFRTWVYATKSKSIIKRMLNYLSFASTALFFGFFFIRDIDLLFWESPPLFLGPFARVLAWSKHAKCIMNVADLWPETAIALGLVSKDSKATRLAERLEMWLYRHSDAITGQTQGIIDYIAHRVPSIPIHLFPNGVDLELFKPLEPDPLLAQKLGLANKFVVGYGGLMGYVSGLEQAIDAAEQLKDQKDIVFAMFGDGPVKDSLIEKSRKKNLSNVRFFPTQEVTLMPKIMSLWDIGLVTLADRPLFSGVRPSKMFAIMGVGKPIVYCGRGEGAAIVEKNACGVVVPPERPDLLAKAIRSLYEDRSKLNKMGINALRAARE